MLHLESVEPDTLELLRQLQRDPALAGLRLVGGTSLALQIGHRKSEDLDLFGKLKVRGSELEQTLRLHGRTQLVSRSRIVETYLVRDVKVDFVDYPYVWLADAVETEGVVLAVETDIAPMKLEAITGRGRKKDFIDLTFLLERYPLDTMLSWYRDKYPQGSEYLVLRSLVYFNDAEDEPMPVMLKPLDWETAKERIRVAVRRKASE